MFIGDLNTNLTTQFSDGPIMSTKISPCGCLVAAALADSTVQIWSTDYRSKVFKLKVRNSKQLPFHVTSLAWIPGQSAAVDQWKLFGSCFDGSIFYWDPQNKINQQLLNGENNYRSIDFDQGGQQFVVCGTEVEVRDAQTFKQVFSIRDEEMTMTSKFNPQDGNVLYTGHADGIVKFWDVRSRDCQQIINAGTSICGDAVDIDGKQVVTGGGWNGEGILIWDLRHTKSHIKQIQSSNPIVCLKFLPGMGLIFCGSHENSQPAKVIETCSGQIIHHVSQMKRSCLSVDINSNTSQLCCGDVFGNLFVDTFDSNQYVDFQQKTEISKPNCRKVIVSPPELIKRQRAVIQYVKNTQSQKEQPFRDQSFYSDSDKEPQIEQKILMLIDLKLGKKLERQTIFGQSSSVILVSSQGQNTLNAGFSPKNNKFNVNMNALPEGMVDIKRKHKRQMLEQVSQKVLELEQSFQKQEAHIQNMVQQEHEDAQSEILQTQRQTFNKNLSKDQHLPSNKETKKFIKTIEEHLQDSKHEFSTRDLQSNVHPDLDATMMSMKLPLITGKVQNMKILLQQDLLQDGLIRKNSILKGQNSVKSIFQSKISLAPSNASEIQQQFQKNLVVEHPDLDDQVAQIFPNYWKVTQEKGKRFSVSVTPCVRLMKENQSVSSVIASARKEVIRQKSPNFKQIQDSDHLARLKNRLVEEQQKLKQQQNKYDPSLNEIMGESLSEVQLRIQKKMQREQEIKDLKELGDAAEQEDISSDESLPDRTQESYQTQESEEVFESQEEEKQWQKQLKHYLNKKDYSSMQKAVDLLSSNQKYLEYLKQSDQDELKNAKSFMQNNPYFKKFAANYSKSIIQVIEEKFGKKFQEFIHQKNSEKINEKLMSHLKDQNYFRKNLPTLFTGVNTEHRNELAKEMSLHLKAVSLPRQMKQQVQAEAQFRNQNLSPSDQRFQSFATVDPLQDEGYLRRLKMANYGKWFVRPSQYSNQVEWFNRKLNDSKE